VNNVDSSIQPALSKKPHILLLGTQIATGGAQRVLLDQASWLHENGFKVFAGFLYEKENLLTLWKDMYPFPILSFGFSRPDDSKFQRLIHFVTGFWGLLVFLIKEKIQSVETFTHHSNILGIVAAFLAGCPVRIATHHGMIENFPEILRIVHTFIINSSMANGFVCVSERTRQSAMKEGIREERITVIANGIKPSPVHPDAALQIRSEMGVKEGMSLVLTAGRLTYQKAHTFLLKAIPRVIQNFPGVVFAIAGDGVLRKDLEQETRDLGITACVRFLGFRGDVLDLMAASDIFVLPSRSEGMPLVVLEAMSVGVPVVATQVEGIAEVIQDGICGYLVQPEDEFDLSEKMISLLKNPAERKRLGLAAQRRVLETYSLEKTCVQYARLLHPEPRKND
jgi:glycosyltransferase involved in cell wall biosynthesis